MELYSNKQWIADIDEVLQNLPELAELADSRVLVTGSTGLICSALVEMLARWNDTREEKISIITTGRTEAGVRASLSMISRKSKGRRRWKSDTVSSRRRHRVASIYSVFTP